MRQCPSVTSTHAPDTQLIHADIPAPKSNIIDPPIYADTILSRIATARIFGSWTTSPSAHCARRASVRGGSSTSSSPPPRFAMTTPHHSAASTVPVRASYYFIFRDGLRCGCHRGAGRDTRPSQRCSSCTHIRTLTMVLYARPRPGPLPQHFMQNARAATISKRIMRGAARARCTCLDVPS